MFVVLFPPHLLTSQLTFFIVKNRPYCSSVALSKRLGKCISGPIWSFTSFKAMWQMCLWLDAIPLSRHSDCSCLKWLAFYLYFVFTFFLEGRWRQVLSKRVNEQQQQMNIIFKMMFKMERTGIREQVAIEVDDTVKKNSRTKNANLLTIKKNIYFYF